MTPGSLRGLVLVVPDIRVAHAELDRAGVQTGGVVVSGDGVDLRPARDDDDLDDVGFVHFTDPDGNGWTVQQISAPGVAVATHTPAGLGRRGRLLRRRAPWRPTAGRSPA
jgi:hypothetical protein